MTTQLVPLPLRPTEVGARRRGVSQETVGLPLPTTSAVPATPAAPTFSPRDMSCYTQSSNDYETSADEQTSTCHVFSVLSMSGAVGTSTFASLLALKLTQYFSRCALIDAVPESGGLDVLLGLEADKGLRWNDIEAPMGRLDSQALRHELVHWENLDILAANPWKADSNLEPWEIKAAYVALCEGEDVFVVDGDVSALSAAQEVLRAARVYPIVLVEMSLLGVARTQAWIRSHENLRGDTLFLAVSAPQQTRKNRKLLDVDGIEEYLDIEIAQVLRCEASLEKSLAAGIGITSLPKSYEKLLSGVIDFFIPQDAYASTHLKRGEARGHGR